MDALAVIGVSFKLPQGVVDDDGLWEVLESGTNLSTEWPADRAAADSFYESANGSMNRLPTRKGHFLSGDIAAFDAPFFSITAQEAAAMDPQHRWALETSYHAFESAGISLESLRGSRTAVFTASTADDYMRLFAKDPDTMPRTAISGASHSILANRLSWYFDLQGPSMHIDTACSSSLVALDTACQTLLHRDASQVLIIGSSLMISPEGSMLLSNMKFLSPDGVCHTFDEQANGYARGEGIIAMIIKPVATAIHDGDPIRAVIRATGSNQDGHTPGLTQPSADAQERLIREVYNRAGLGYESTRYFEAHGTGTILGDRTEIEAIGRVFKDYRSTESPLYVGSIKANIGHLEGASGLAGMLKSIQILERGIIPPNANLQNISPALNLEQNSVMVPKKAVNWPTETLRRISLTSYGFGGSNAHIILDDAFGFLQGLHAQSPVQHTYQPRLNGCSGDIDSNKLNDDRDKHTNGEVHCLSDVKGNSSPIKGPYLLTWTADDSEATHRLLGLHEQYYESHIKNNNAKLAQLAYTLSTRRSLMTWRSFTVIDPTEDFKHKNASPPLKSSRLIDWSGLAMVFTGQGAQYSGMGLRLVQYPVFQQTLKDADDALSILGCTWSIFDKLLDVESIHMPQYSQPICTALQIALVSLLRSFGIHPTVVVGHSSGEIAASYTIGALSLESAMKVAFHRGKLVQDLKAELSTTEVMMSVNIPQDSVESYIESSAPDLVGKLHISCVNSPVNCTLSGNQDAIDSLFSRLEADQVFAAKLRTGVAYHSPTMQRIAYKYRQALEPLSPGLSEVKVVSMVSSVTGQTISRETLLTADYWVDNLVSRVRFSDAVTHLLKSPPSSGPITDFMEVGPHSALHRPVNSIITHVVPEGLHPRYHSVLDKSMCSVRSLLTMLGNLFCIGFPISVARANQQMLGQKDENTTVLRDCPKYPFDRTRNYWSESRIARGYRLRKKVPSDSLGTPANDWNPLEPRWRNLLSVERLPWIGEHVINDTILYPGTGMLVMAIEAAKQTAPANRHISGFKIEEAFFLNPLIFGETASEVTEAMIHSRPIQGAFDKESASSEVTIYSCSQDDRWSKCFMARIQVLYKEVNPQSDTEMERLLEQSHVQQKYENASKTCSQLIDAKAFYSHSQQSGIRYGNSFQLLRGIRWDGKDTAVARVQASPIHSTPSLVHPAILDATLQLSITQVSRGLSKAVAAMVPHQLRDTWVSAEGWDNLSAAPLRVMSALTFAGRSGAHASITALSDSGTPLFTLGNLKMAPLSSAKTNESVHRHQRLIHKIEMKPQLSLQSPLQLARICNSGVCPADPTTMATFYINLEAALVKISENVLNKMSSTAVANLPSHLQKLASTLRHQTERRRESGTVQELSDAQAHEILDRSEDENPGWRIFPIVARNLKAIFNGEMDALDLIFTNSLADAFYRSVFNHCCDQRFYKYLELLSHENPGLRILEIGAGTGGLTRNILSILHSLEKDSGTTRYQSFVYTDISPSFFESARNEFQGTRISFQTFDVETDPTSQGLEPGAYDLVIAGGVVHATKSLDATLKNVHALLKPGGKLILVEIVAPDSIHATVGYGVLPGWWLSEEKSRALSPCISENHWDQVLSQTGFSGTDMTFKDYESDECHICSIMFSTAQTHGQSAPHLPFRRVIAVIPQEREHERDLAREVAKSLECNIIVTLPESREVKLDVDDIVIVLLEIGSPLLASIAEQDFRDIQHLTSDASTLIWVTRASPLDERYPQFGLATGLLRSLRMEAAEKRLVRLAIESRETQTLQDVAGYISKVMQASLGDVEKPEIEYIVCNGQLSCARVAEHISMDEKIQSMLYPRKVEQPLGTGPATKLVIGTPGMLDTLQFVEDPSRERELGEDELEIEARAWAINFRDVIVALDRLPGEDFGCDCAGIVTRVGPGCAFRPGDRVGVCAPASMRTHVRTTSPHAFLIPGEMTLNEAASFISPAATAYHCLMNIAQLQPKEKILIHSAAGTTGQMAVLIAKHCGAEVFATVGSDEKKNLLIEKFSIDPSHIFYSRNTSFARGILRLTDGQGVDVVLNSLSGESLRASWNCIAPYGRFIEIGKSDIASDSSLPMANFQGNVSFTAVDLFHMNLTRPATMAKILGHVLDLLSKGVLRYPHPIHVLPASKIESGFRAVQSGHDAGRFVVEADPLTAVPKLLSDKSTWTFDAEATYIIVGGLGGLGRAICKWMMQKGARNFILPSRSGPRSPAASQLVESLRNAGACIEAPVCDAASLADLSATLDSYAKTMPPVKGCINSAMALHDSIFESMQCSQWNEVIRSKVDTSWNLHKLLPDDLDFFILLSSLSGLYGNVSQSSYAAGCTFQDSLAEYCNLHDRKAISLDIGWMRTIGIISEREDYQRNMVKAQDMFPIEEEEFLALLDLCCNPHESFHPVDAVTRSQIMIGATTPSWYLKRGEPIPPPLRVRLFSTLAGSLELSSTAAASSATEYPMRFIEAKTLTEKAAIVSDALIDRLARALLVSKDYIERDQTLVNYGVDSLMAIELRNWAINDFHAKVAVFEMMDRTIVGIGELIAQRSQKV